MITSWRSHGTVGVNPDGRFTYIPEQDYTGSDSFTFTATDSFGASDTETILIENDGLPTGVSVYHVRDAIEGIQTGIFRFHRPANVGVLTVHFEFAPNSSATLDDPSTPPGDGDFTATHVPYSVTFADLQSEIVVTVTAYDDELPEGAESFWVDILNYAAPGQGAVPYTIGANHARIYIKDPPNVYATGTLIAEGDTGTTSDEVGITLSYAVDYALTVNFLTVDGTATTGDNDYVAIGSGSVVIPAGQTTPSTPPHK